VAVLHEEALGDSAQLCEAQALIEMQGMGSYNHNYKKTVTRKITSDAVKIQLLLVIYIACDIMLNYLKV
jgi:hypothetical protein